MSPTTPAVVFDGVWKKFRRGELHDSLRDLLPAVTRRLLGRANRTSELAQREFWALQDVTFQVGPGDVLGVIGANGAGKSTVLKTMTRILQPNRGWCRVSGRIGALIEVSSGFHPDLTGRENVFLQGAVMGMPSSLIRQRFDDIVDFSGIPEFIDTPVKRYSSGMNARLGFSIAAHLDPDILVIDEVLSVGDYAFQRRAFDRIAMLASSGIPVVVVSHQLNRIIELCTRAILLDRGCVVTQGDARECVSAYVLGQSHHADPLDDACPIRLDAIEGDGSEKVRSGDSVTFRVTGRILRELQERLEHVDIRVRTLSSGAVIFATNTTNLQVTMPEQGTFSVAVQLQFNVPPGSYLIETAVWDPYRHRDAFTGPRLTLTVEEGPAFSGSVQMNPKMWLLPRD